MQHIHGYILQEEVQNYLATKPEGRYMFVFTPTHGSWLNLIESFFSKMTKQMLKGIRVNTSSVCSSCIPQMQSHGQIPDKSGEKLFQKNKQ